MIKLIFMCIVSLGTGFVTSVSVIQSEKLQTFVPGQTVTLSCNIFRFNENHFYWFRQSLGEGPLCIVNLYAGKRPQYCKNFEHENSRITAEKKENLFTLTIKELKPNDMGIYYCAIWSYNFVEFGSGVFLSYEGSDLKHQHYIKEVVSLDQTQDSQLKESLHPGDNVTLQCTVVAQSCAGEHSVFWIRHGSGESHPGIIYTDGDSSDQCKNRSDAGSSTQSCIYSLPKRNLRTSDAGTYYCAVATCGKILFGNGSALELTGNDELAANQMQQTILGLAVLTGMCFIIIAVLLCALAKKRNIGTSENRDIIPTFEHEQSHPSASVNNKSVERADLSYAALKFPAKKSKRRETQRDSHQTVIYSSVRGLNSPLE